MAEIPQFLLDNPRKYTTTEMFLPINVGIGPVVRHSEPSSEGWYARIDSAVELDRERGDDAIWSCDHIHPTENEAWACVDAFTRVLVDRVARRAES